MARYTESVCKLCRREGEKLFLKGARCYSDKCGMERRPYPPGVHGQKRQKRSDYAIQLREKQKLKRLYGIQEKQMRNMFDKALRMQGVTGENLMTLLERRLDNVVYRIGLAASRKEARQLVKHGHFALNGKKVNLPAILVKKGDTIEVTEASRSVAKLSTAIDANSIRELPAWIEVDKTLMRGKIKDLPNRQDITATVEERLVVELYSK